MDKFNKVVDAAYATALDHRLSVSLALALKALPDAERDDDTLAQHISRARQIAADKSRTLIDLPRLTLTGANTAEAAGHVPIEHASNAESVCASSGEELKHPATWGQIKSWLLEDVRLTGLVRLTLRVGEIDHTCFAHPIADSSRGDGVQLVFMPGGTEDRDALVNVAKHALGLSQRQAEIAVRIHEGKSAEAIAEDLSITGNTVRTHTRAIYARLGVQKQVDIAILIGQMRMLSARLSQPQDRQRTSRDLVFAMTNFLEIKRQRRRVCYSLCGAPGGRVCLMFHSSFGGRWMTETAARALADAGLLLAIPERPGIGLTDAEPKGADRIETAISDALAVAGELTSGPVHALSVSGSAFLLDEAVRREPQRFLSVSFISPRAFDPNTQEVADSDALVNVLAGLPETPLEFIGEVLNSARDFHANLVRSVLAENPVDLMALDDPDLMQMHIDQLRSNGVRGAAGLAQEWVHYGKPQRPGPPVKDVLYRVLLGEKENMAAVKQGMRDWSGHFGVPAITLPDAGHLHFLTHTKALLRALSLSN